MPERFGQLSFTLSLGTYSYESRNNGVKLSQISCGSMGISEGKYTWLSSAGWGKKDEKEPTVNSTVLENISLADRSSERRIMDYQLTRSKTRVDTVHGYQAWRSSSKCNDGSMTQLRAGRKEYQLMHS